MSLLRIVTVFALTALILAMAPGPGRAMVRRQTMTGSARCAMASVGLSQVFTHSPGA